jgi:hypothetical protein
MEWKCKECGRADPGAPEHDHPLQVVQKTVTSIGWLALHRQILTGFLIVRSEARRLEYEQSPCAARAEAAKVLWQLCGTHPLKDQERLCKDLPRKGPYSQVLMSPA